MKFYFLIILTLIINLKCFEHTIKNCEKIDKTNINRCEICEDKYFLFYNNLFCLPCDDKYYGQIGCDGNCDSSKYENDRFVYCNDECKEGFYNLNGICFNCTKGSPGCKICNVTEIEGNQIDYKYTCQECLNNEYRLVNQIIIYLQIKLVKDVIIIFILVMDIVLYAQIMKQI